MWSNQVQLKVESPTAAYCHNLHSRQGQDVVNMQYLLHQTKETIITHSTTWPNVPRTIPIRPIQPNPTQFTKGIFVYSTLYNQIVVGPTATDQTSRIDKKIDQKVATELVSHAKRVLGPQFDDTKLIGDYVGIRPGTNQRDYQIHSYHGANFITVGGIRSTGLTASLGIGRHVVQCLLPSIFRGLLLLMMKVSYWLLLHHYQM